MKAASLPKNRDSYNNVNTNHAYDYDVELDGAKAKFHGISVNSFEDPTITPTVDQMLEISLMKSTSGATDAVMACLIFLLRRLPRSCGKNVVGAES